jgi:tetratricopeptide (TPR) repeat protein
MTPAYEDTREIPLNLPVLTSCLDCHVSGARPPVAGTENKYQLPVFVFAGVTCERCHGPGAQHVAGGAIVNPRKLAAERRDQVCMQCHLEGNIAIEAAGKHLYEYRPGDNLFQYVRYYTTPGTANSAMRAVSQFEALAQSACQRKSGERMSCISCHDPHRTVPPEQRVAFYRAKCLACHGEKFAARHHPAQPDCTTCHMPAASSKDIAHAEVTDHRIPRKPDMQTVAQLVTATPMLQVIPFPNNKEAEHNVRDLALAWESVATSGASDAQPQATLLLRRALAQSPDDATLLSALAYADQRRGDTKNAFELYTRALRNDATLLDAATNLGVIDAQKGDIKGALELWKSAFERAPGRSAIGINLARAYCAQGDASNARRTLSRVLEFAPDFPAAREMLHSMDRNGGGCGL